MRTRWFALALVTVLAALGSAPVASSKAMAPNATTVTVTMKEFKFTLSKRTVARGLVTFKLVNKGALSHDFKIAGKKSKMIGSGKSGLFQRHAEQGLQGLHLHCSRPCPGRHEGVAESHLARAAGPLSSCCPGPPGPPRQDGAVRRLLMLIAVLGAAAPVVLFAVQDDEGAPAASAAAHEHHAAQVGLPPQRAVVLARESRELAVALAIEPGMPLRLTATIINGQGAGVDGLDVELIAGTAASGASNRGRTCGRGCYTTSLPVRAPTRFAVNIAGAGPVRSVAFPLPGRWAPTSGAAFLARATRAFRVTANGPLRRAPLLGSRAHDLHDVEARSAEQRRVRDPGRRRRDRHRPHALGPFAGRRPMGGVDVDTPAATHPVLECPGGERVRACTARLAA